MSNTTHNFSNWENQNITLAAVAQCAALVYELAFTGKVDQKDLISSINPLFVLNPNSFSDVYPDLEHLNLGLNTVQKILTNNKTRKNAEIIRYTLGMLTLRKRLKNSSRIQRIIRESLVPIVPLHPLENDRKNLSGEDLELLKQDRTFRQLSQIYQETISTLPFRIQVAGKVEHLKSENVANRIRGLLFGGIRSAVLWHQLKGRRWQLLFYRKQIQKTAEDIRQKLSVML